MVAKASFFFFLTFQKIVYLTQRQARAGGERDRERERETEEKREREKERERKEGGVQHTRDNITRKDNKKESVWRKK